MQKKLNEIITIYGFGCEFDIAELTNNFEDAQNLIKALHENNLVEKNQLTGKYYLSDIFTCNNFLSQYLKEEKQESQKKNPRENVQL